MNRTLPYTAIAASGLFAGCGAEPLAGPPDLRLGRDECAECGMLISEDRCSTALLVDAAGRNEHRMFDDIGCMLDWEHDHAGETPVLGWFVHDHGTRSWIGGDDAHYLLTDPQSLATPMGSGIVAFADAAAASRKREECGGEVLTLECLRPARRAWMEARYGSPGAGR